MYELKDKVALVTGASGTRGIGANVVRSLLDEGVKHVRMLDINEKAGLELQDELIKKFGANKAKFVKCDVTNEEQFCKAIEDAKNDNGYLDLLVNNAGVTTESNLSQIRKLIEINVIAVITGTLKAIELMRTDKGGRGGTVINVASIAGLLQVSPMFTYSTSKRAVLQFSTCVGRVPVENTGVRVMAICIGCTDTGILELIKTIEKRLDNEAEKLIAALPLQRVESVSRGMIEMYKKGESASTWLVQCDKPIKDITQELLREEENTAKVVESNA